ncbi:hypothetical protein AB0H63_01435 [Micromonospora echinospora]|uniref:hypothetical protein n=1 Tax=Micromonospora echinospora TaxID=1877 RepID=UPI0033FAE2CE
MTPIVLLASLAALIYAASYAIRCAISPWGRCRRCHGTGNRPALIGRRRDCPRCNGTGIRVRIGRRIAEHIRTEYRAGHQ